MRPFRRNGRRGLPQGGSQVVLRRLAKDVRAKPYGGAGGVAGVGGVLGQ
jgi:hypothetical protein